MSQLLNTINTELDALDGSANTSLAKILENSQDFLSNLKQIESQLSAQIDTQVEHGEQAFGGQDSSAIVQKSDEIAETEIKKSLMSRKHSLVTTDNEFVDTEIDEGRVTPLDSARASESVHSYEDPCPSLHQVLDKASSTWYKTSIDLLKKYNAQVTKFQKNVVQKLNINLDDAYTFPLALPLYPSKDIRREASDDPQKRTEQLNQDQLLKSIILHLLKTGQGTIAEELLTEYSMESQIDPKLLNDFKELSVIVHDIESRHELSNVLEWLESRTHHKDVEYENLAFKFHMLQFALLLNSSQNKTPESSIFDAYTYAKQKFPAYARNFLSEMSPIITCILFTSQDHSKDPHLNDLKHMTMRNYIATCEKSKRNTKETRFVAQLLENLHQIHESQFLFDTLAHDFVAKFCSDLSLSSESSLFQSVLSGFVNLPNFYRYSHVQRKLKRPNPSEGDTDPAASKKDLPFQIPDKNQFLFNYHPIFICPISKEQLMPLVTVSKVTESDLQLKSQNPVFVSKNKILVPMSNPVVVFGHCRHLALKDSVRQLTRGGAEIFKCHYCYKKHKLSEVSEAFFIDL